MPLVKVPSVHKSFVGTFSNSETIVIIAFQFACLVAVVVADYNTPIPILKDDRTQNAYGEYTFDFETGNGISRNEAGQQADGQETSGGWR